ncbi:MAG: F0F1 ATP synthase subunit epsilon [Deltaproteobacteria bacterium]
MLNLEIITPRRLLVHEEVEMVEARGDLGDFGILPGHIKFLTTLDVGEIRYIKNGRARHLFTGGGFGEVVDDRIVFLVDTAEFAEEIDVDRAERTVKWAESVLNEISTDSLEHRMYELALLRSIARISVASKKL